MTVLSAPMYLDDDLDPIARAVQRTLEGYLVFFYDAWVNQNINAITGDYVEFGSWGANTMHMAYEGMKLSGRTDRHMWAYDSFLQSRMHAQGLKTSRTAPSHAQDVPPDEVA